MNPTHQSLGLLLLTALTTFAADTAPRPLAPPMPYLATVLKYENFDEVYLIGGTNADQLNVGPFSLVGSYSGYALSRSGPGTLTPFIINGTDESGNRMLDAANGAFQCYFTPDWSTGVGPGTNVVLAELAAVGERNSVIVLFSLQVTPDGSALSLVADSPTGPIELIHTGINWQACIAQHVAMNFGTNGTQLFVNGHAIAESGATLAFAPHVLQMALGSGLDGSAPSGGAFEEFYSFGKSKRQAVALTPDEVSFYFNGTSNSAALGPMSDAQAAAWEARRASRIQSGTSGLRSMTGKPGLKPSAGMHFKSYPPVGSPGCITNGWPYLTNILVESCGPSGTNLCVGLSVAGGTNDGTAYLLYRSTNLAAPFLSPSWQFVQFLHACEWTYLTSDVATCFFRLSTTAKSSVNDPIPDWWKVAHGLDPADPTVATRDDDGDLVPNYWEYIYGTDPHIVDSDYDSVPEGREVYFDGTPPNDSESHSNILLGSWRFDSTNWTGLQGQLPLSNTNLALVPGLTGNAVSINSTNPAWLIYRDYETNSLYGNINFRKGSARVWLKAAWNSTGTNSGAGPGNEAPIISFGSKATTWWALTLDAKGTNLSLVTPTSTNGAYKTNLSAKVAWTSNQWVQIVCVWSPTNSALYINGQAANTNGSGVSLWPDVTVRAEGWKVGSDGNTNQIRGRLDNLQTFNYMLSDTEIANGYSTPCWSAIDVMLVIDRSNSMNEDNKLHDARIAATNFVGHLNFNHDRAGLVSFSSTSTLDAPLTNNASTVVAAISNLNTSGGTRIDLGIDAAQSELATHRLSDSAPLIILLSDGVPTEGTAGSVTNSANAAKDAGTRLITVALGTTGVDTNLLRYIASSSADFYHATDSSQLDTIYNLIANSLCRLTNLPPAVSITNPTNNQNFVYPASIRINATASDPEDALVGVAFYSGTNALGTNYHAPYSVVWGTASHGTNILTAVAWDEANFTTTSAPVNIVVVGATPTIQISNPADGQTLISSPTNVLVNASASVAGGTITNVTFYTNGTLLGSVSNLQAGTFNAQFLWTNVSAGTFSLSAIATDNRGATATATNHIIVNAMPLVSITTPTNLQTYAEVTNVLITGHVSDPDGTNYTVQLYSGAAFITNALVTGTNFSATWSNRHAGTYRITAFVADSRGATGHSDLRVFRVSPSNPPPSVQITYPTSNMVFHSGVTITITAIATNSPAVVTNVQFFANRRLLGSDSVLPYSVTECCWQPGHYVLTAQATDNSGATHVSDPVEIDIQATPPALAGDYWDPAFTLPLVAAVRAISVSGSNTYCIAETDGYSVDYLYRWDGANWSRWSATDGNLPLNQLYGLATFTGGLYVIGTDVISNAVHVAMWDGTNWSILGEPFGGDLAHQSDFRESFKIYCLKVVGPDLYAGGLFASVGGDTNLHSIVKWNPNTPAWEAIGNGVDGPVYAIASLRDSLVVGGEFPSAGGNTNARCIARLDHGVWTNLGTGVAGTNCFYVRGAVFALATCGTNLFAGGDFTSAGGKSDANGIAWWNGREWQTIGRGFARIPTYPLEAAEDPPNPMVFTINALGDSIYVGGNLSAILGEGSDYTPIAGVAKATWNEDQQQWNWADLDLGVYRVSYPSSPVAYPGWVISSDILEGSDPKAYDWIVGGDFIFAGSSMTNANYFVEGPYYNNLARWRVAQNAPTNSPSVTLLTPTNHTIFTNPPDSISFSAVASSSANITNVDFYAGGLRVGRDPSYAAAYYTNDWSFPPAGAYLLKAVASDENGRIGVSKPRLLVIEDPDNTVLASNDVFYVDANSPPASLDVLANDFTTTTNALRIVNAARAGVNIATVEVAYDKKSITYTLTPNAYGHDFFAYSVTDGVSTNATYAEVFIRTKPKVQITSPGDGSRFRTNTTVTITSTAQDYDGFVTNIALLVNGAALSHGTNSPFTVNWQTNATGFYTFNAIATDNDGKTNVSQPVTIAVTNVTSPNGPIADIQGLTVTDNGLGGTILPVIRDGFYDLQGTARDPDGDPVSYAVLLFRPEDLPNAGDDLNAAVEGLEPYANVTPGTLNAQGFHNGAVTNASVGQIDLTRFANGAYYLVLRVHGGTDETNDVVQFRLDSQLKIGQFSFSEQDLVIPANGFPITVTRTYDSRNPRSADFGYSWSYALNTMDVQLDEQRQNVTVGTDQSPFADDETDDSGLPRLVSIRTSGGWDVTLTLPDGRRTTFAFTPRYRSDDCQADAYWTPPADVTAKLETLDSGVINLVPHSPVFWQDGGENSTFDNHDIKGWKLTTLDGTQYFITRGDPNNLTYQDSPGHFINVKAYDAQPRLTSIVQRTGDKIVISDDAISHYNPTNGLTRRTWFERDEQGRIIQIRDPNSGADGKALIKYLYHRDTGNLLQVQRLQDRTNGTYLTTKYHYDNPNFPHFITSIEDPRGVPLARNEYDDDGRLTAIIDADGNRTEFRHDTFNRVEVVIDRLGHTNSLAYDVHGNVTATTNALGEAALIAYDDNNNKTNEVLGLSPTNPNGQTNVYEFNTNGLMTRSVIGGVTTNTFTYDDLGNPIATLDGTGHGSTNVYNPGTSTLTSTTDALGNTTSYSYENGLLASTADPLGAVTVNHYDDAGNLASTAVLTYQYPSGLNPTNPPIVTILKSNFFTYDSNGNRMTSSHLWTGPGVTNAAITTTTEYDSSQRIVRAVDPDGNETRTYYNALGRVDYTVDKFSNTNSFKYDARGNAVENTGPNGLPTRTAYNPDGRPVLTSDANGITGTRTDYDPAGRVIASVRLSNVVISVTAAGDNFWTSSVDSSGTPYATNSTEYFPLGWVKSRTGQDGRKTTYDYWPDGQLKSVTDALTNVTSYQYDPAGRQKLVQDAANHTTQFEYDFVGRLVRTIFADSASTSNYLNAVSQTLAATDQAGVTKQFAYNAIGQLTDVIMPAVPDPENSNQAVTPVWNYQYDAYNHLAVIKDAKNRTTTNTFDSIGRQLNRRLPHGETETNVFNAKGQLATHFDFKGQRTEFVYDRFNRVKAKFFYDSGASYPSNAVCYSYNQLGQLTNINERTGADCDTNLCDGFALLFPRPTSPSGKRYFATLAKTPPEIAGQVSAIALLAAAGLAMLSSRTNRRRIQALAPLFPSLPSVNSEVKIHVHRCSSVVRFFFRPVTYALIICLVGNECPFDRLLTASAECVYPENTSTETTRNTSFLYDFDGHLIQKNTPEGVINYEYDLATGRHTRTCSTNSEVAYGYDELGRLKTVTAIKRNGVTLTNAEVTTYTYTATGNRSTVTLPNGIVTTYQYDALNRLTNLTHQAGTTNLATYKYTLHSTGRRTGATEIIRQEDGTYQTNTLTWQYDQMYRLTNEVSISSSGASGTFTNAYAYYKVGNRFSKTHYQNANTTVITNVFNENDQLLKEVTKFNGTLTETNWYAYDLNGSVIAKTNVASGGTTTVLYGYDLKNKLSSVTTLGSSITNYFLYNDEGIRVRSSSSGGSATYYLIDANNHTGYQQILEELASPGATASRSYVIGDDVITQASDDPYSPSHILADGHGSSRQLASSAVIVTAALNYDAFGLGLANSTHEGNTSDRYCGEQYDATLGMYNLRARYYDPANGRFSAADSFNGNNADPNSLHKYSYCQADPINGKDPSGNFLLLGELLGWVLRATLITKLVIFIGVPLLAGWWLYSRFHGRAMDADEDAHFTAALAVLKDPALKGKYVPVLNRMQRITVAVRVVSDSEMLHKKNEFAHTAKPFNVLWLSESTPNLDPRFLAAILVHESVHMRQWYSYPEGPAWQATADFLRDIGIDTKFVNDHMSTLPHIDQLFLAACMQQFKAYAVQNSPF